MPTVRGWAALGVAAALLLLWIAFGEVELLGTAAFLVAAVLFGVVFVRLGQPRAVIARRIFPGRVHEGDTAVVEVEMTGSSRTRNLTLEDSVEGLGVARFAAARAGVRHALIARYEIACRVRGIYPVGPATIGVADPFGLADRTVAVGGPDRLVVFPLIEDLDGLPAVSGHAGSVQTARPTYSPHGGEDFFTLREYQVGDDLRKVHWPSSAKRDRLMIRQLEIPWMTRALVLFDQRAERYATSDSFEHAVRGAASAVAHLWRGGFSPELWAADRAAPPRSGDRFAQAMELLAGIEARPGIDLRSTVSRVRRSSVGGGALVIVTGGPDDSVLAAHRALTGSFARTLVMAVTSPADDGIAVLDRAGATTIPSGPASPWAPAWRTAMELSWSTASAG